MFSACSGITVTLKFCVLCVLLVLLHLSYLLNRWSVTDPVESVSSPGSRSKRHLPWFIFQWVFCSCVVPEELKGVAGLTSLPVWNPMTYTCEDKTPSTSEGQFQFIQYLHLFVLFFFFPFLSFFVDSFCRKDQLNVFRLLTALILKFGI